MGGTATLAGTISRSTAWYLVGTLSSVVADAGNGSVGYTMGPITAGPFGGKTFTFVGEAPSWSMEGSDHRLRWDNLR